MNQNEQQTVMPEVLPARDARLEQIIQLAQSLSRLSELRETQANELKNTESKIQQISENLLPSLLSDLGLTELRLENGERIGVKTDYFASIPKDQRGDAAFAWLRERNMGGIIKEQILVEPTHREALDAQGIAYSVSMSIHPSTLRSFVKERITDPTATEEFPRELFAVHTVNKAVIKS